MQDRMENSCRKVVPEKRDASTRHNIIYGKRTKTQYRFLIWFDSKHTSSWPAARIRYMRVFQWKDTGYSNGEVPLVFITYSNSMILSYAPQLFIRKLLTNQIAVELSLHWKHTSMRFLRVKLRFAYMKISMNAFPLGRMTLHLNETGPTGPRSSKIVSFL